MMCATRYLIEGTSHSITNWIHHVKVDLKKIYNLQIENIVLIWYNNH